MQIPFQYSLHYIEKVDGELKHKEFLAEAGVDPRRKLAERLVEDIPNDVCVLAYNMKFEKMVIKDLAETYSDLKEDLLKIRENIQDLMIPFKIEVIIPNKCKAHIQLNMYYLHYFQIIQNSIIINYLLYIMVGKQ